MALISAYIYALTYAAECASEVCCKYLRVWCLTKVAMMVTVGEDRVSRDRVPFSAKSSLTWVCKMRLPLKSRRPKGPIKLQPLAHFSALALYNPMKCANCDDGENWINAIIQVKLDVCACVCALPIEENRTDLLWSTQVVELVSRVGTHTKRWWAVLLLFRVAKVVSLVAKKGCFWKGMPSCHTAHKGNSR